MVFADEDEFLLEDDFVASDTEALAETVHVDDAPSNKRKTLNTDDALQPAKKKKRKNAAKDSLQQDQVIGWSIPTVQAAYLYEKQLLSFPHATLIEQEEFKLKDSWIMDTSLCQKEDRKTLAGFIQEALPDLAKQVSKSSKKKGSPRAIVVCGAAMRVADIARDLKTLTPQGEVAKLFSKHFKLSEHEAYCQKTAFSLATGTPDRIHKLITSSALSLDSIQYLILDITHLDAKNKSVLDQKETRDVILKHLLQIQRIREKLEGDRLKLVFY